jgi:hypothetical protein
MFTFAKMALAALDTLEQIINIIFIFWCWWKSLLHHLDFHHCAKLKLGSDQRCGSPLVDGSGRHGPNVS